MFTSPPSLLRDGHPVVVTPKPLATLVALVESHGKAISKDVLLASVWSNTAVEEGNLSQNIYTLRKLLVRDFPDQVAIENIRRVGYRFNLAVEEEARAPDTTSGVENARAHNPESSGSAPVLETTGNVKARETPSQSYFTLVRKFLGAKRRKTAWVFLLAILLLLALGWHFAGRTKATAATIASLHRFTSNTGDDRVTAAAISADGQWIAYADADGVVVQGTNEAATHAVPTPAFREIDRIAWNPDNRQLLTTGIAASGVPQLWMLDATNSGKAPVLVWEHAKQGEFSPDGSSVAFVTDNGAEIWVAGPKGENARRVLAGSPIDSFPALRWSADGNSLMLERHTTIQSDGHYHAVRTEDEIEGFHSTYLTVAVASGRITASEDAIRIGDMCLLAPDDLLFSRSEQNDYSDSTSLWNVTIDPQTGKFVSIPRRIRDLKQLRLLTLSAAKRTGRIVAVLKHGSPGVYVGTLQAGGKSLSDTKAVTARGGNSFPHAWSPDSRSIFFESDYGATDFHAYRQDLNRHDPELLAPNLDGTIYPRVTPDGRVVLVETKFKESGISLWRLPMTGGPSALVMQEQEADQYRCPASGSTCVLGGPVDSQRFTFWVLDPVQGRGRELFSMPTSWNAHGDWDISPDGSRLAVVSAVSPQPEIHLIDLSSGRTQEILVPLSSSLDSINWAANGKGWYVAAPTKPGYQLLYIDLNGDATVVCETTGPTWGVPSPDGTKLAFVDQIVDSNVWLISAK